MNEYGNNTAKITYRESFWDERVLGFPSIDIVSIEVIDKLDYTLLIKFFLEYLNNRYKFVSFRMSLQEPVLKKELIKRGFVLVEQSYRVECLNPQLEGLLFSKIDVNFLSDSQEEIEEVKRIAREDFYYGRFFEDPFIKERVAQKRNEYWIDDMIKNPSYRILIAKKNNSVIGFMAFSDENTHVELLLGGLTSKYAHLSYSFWFHLFDNYFKNRLIKTTISCSNLGVVNLYKKFGFNFTEHYVGFHLHI